MIQQTSLREIRTSPDPAMEIVLLVQTQKLVPIPGMGYIKVSIQAASFDQVQGLLIPPGKKLSFEPCSNPDTSLLLNHLCQKFALTTNTARQLLHDFEADMQNQLQIRQSFASLPGLGRFYKDYKGTILFFPEGMTQYKNSIGLPPVNIQPFIQIPAETGNATGTNTPRIKKVHPLSMISFVSVLIGLTTLFLVITDNTDQQTSGEENNFMENLPASIPMDLTDQDGSAFREVGTHDDDLLPLTVINGYADGIR